MTKIRDAELLRSLLARARLMLIFSPFLTSRRDPLEVVESVLPAIDLIQVRIKPRPDAGSSHGASLARETYQWSSRLLDLLRARAQFEVALIVNDRVDVAASLVAAGCAGVHLGQDDCPVAAARQMLGSMPLIGLSTHTAQQVSTAGSLAVDYLGFGPIHATRTKGYERGLGAPACIAECAACSLPVFPIGGIEGSNAAELTAIGRAAVGSAIMSAEDPLRAAEGVRGALGELQR